MIYWRTDTWAILGEYREQHFDRHRVRPDDVPRHLVLMAAFFGSPASETAIALETTPRTVRAIARGRVSPTPRDWERLHAWFACCLWRHLWRCGRDAAMGASPWAEAGAYAACLPRVPALWPRDHDIAGGRI